MVEVNNALIRQAEDYLSKIIELHGIEREYEKRFFDIPFGNSMFQDKTFVMDAQHTPERAYRALGLSLRSRLNALREAYYSLKLLRIDIKELEAKANRSVGLENKYDSERAAVELEKKQHELRDTFKLINDALMEASYLHNLIVKFPEYTREQFEMGEHQHFIQRLFKQAAGIEGAREGLENMGVFDVGSNLKEKGVGGRKISELLESGEDLSVRGPLIGLKPSEIQYPQEQEED